MVLKVPFYKNCGYLVLESVYRHEYFVPFFYFSLLRIVVSLKEGVIARPVSFYGKCVPKKRKKSLRETAGNIFKISLAQFKVNIKLLKCVYSFVCWQSVCTFFLLNTGLKTCIFIHVFSSLFTEVKEKQFSIKLLFSLQVIEC